MARLGRYFLPDQPLHVIQRGNNRQAIFFCADDYRRFHSWLAEAALAHDCMVHAYVLMTNHTHLLVTPGNRESLPRTMQALGRRYVRHVNITAGRTGTLWEGRYRAAPIDSEAYFLACCRYIELNPVRAGMVTRPQDYRWSSYRAHALGATDALVRDHAVYRALGHSPGERRAAYRALFGAPLDAVLLDALRAATNGGWALGDERFRQGLAKAAGRRAAPLPRGRRARTAGDPG
jgi:putative transposase